MIMTIARKSNKTYKYIWKQYSGTPLTVEPVTEERMLNVHRHTLEDNLIKWFDTCKVGDHYCTWHGVLVCSGEVE